jgi:hypothetical protein
MGLQLRTPIDSTTRWASNCGHPSISQRTAPITDTHRFHNARPQLRTPIDSTTHGLLGPIDRLRGIQIDGCPQLTRN